MRAITYLAPGIPMAFFRTVCDHLAAQIGASVLLDSDPRSSGPPQDEPNPLVDGRADLAFACGPSFVRRRAEVRLVGAAPVFDDIRIAGRPAYFAEVVVRRDDAATSLRGLHGARFAYNDINSLTGMLAVLAHLGSRTPPQVRGFVHSGSGEASVAMVASGAADVCSIDSVVWQRLTRESTLLADELRVLESLGPFPIPPVIASLKIDPGRLDTIAEALLAIPSDLLRAFGCSGFARVTAQDYAPLARLLAV